MPIVMFKINHELNPDHEMHCLMCLCNATQVIWRYAGIWGTSVLINIWGGCLWILRLIQKPLSFTSPDQEPIIFEEARVKLLELKLHSKHEGKEQALIGRYNVFYDQFVLTTFSPILPAWDPSVMSAVHMFFSSLINFVNPIGIVSILCNPCNAHWREVNSVSKWSLLEFCKKKKKCAFSFSSFAADGNSPVLKWSDWKNITVQPVLPPAQGFRWFIQCPQPSTGNVWATPALYSIPPLHLLLFSPSEYEKEKGHRATFSMQSFPCHNPKQTNK